MGKQYNRVFPYSTALISILLSLFGLVGAYRSPTNALFIILSIILMVIIVALYDKIDQIDENTLTIAELQKRLNTEKRFRYMERQLAEQKGKLAVIGAR